MRTRLININWGTRHNFRDKNSAVPSKAMESDTEPSKKNKPVKETTNGLTSAEKAASESEDGVSRRFEGKVTPEQELSASVARKRRHISKKRSASIGRPRDQTPVRELDHTSEEEPVEIHPPPKTPERKKSRSRKSSLETSEPATEEIRRKYSLIEDSSTAFDQNKQSGHIKKDVKKHVIKRSQSTPRENIDNSDLIENFMKAQLLTAALELNKPKEIELNKSNNDDKPQIQINDNSSSNQNQPQRPTSLSLFNYILRRRKPEEKEDESKVKKEIKPTVKTKRITFREIRHKWKQFKVDYKEEYDGINYLRNRCFNDITLLMIFCGLGGLVFKFTEGTFENFYKCGVKRVKRDFIDALWRGSHHLREDDWKSLARSKLRMFEEQLHTAHEAGVTSYSGQRAWSFLNGIVYCLTVVTTIGYGHMYPTTTTGRVLTIVYALIGIPLFLIILTDFGKLFTRAIKFLWAFVRRLYYTGTCKKARKTTAMQEVMKGAQIMYEIATFRRPSQFVADEEHGAVNGPPSFPGAQPYPGGVTPHSRDGDTEPPDTPAPSTFEIDDEFNLPVSVAVFLLVVYIFLGAVFYYMWEQWDFFASFYFVFISMSTIGFGDYVPRHPICMIVSIIYLVFGLALMSMCINVVQVKLSDTFRQASAKLGATIGLRVAEEDGSITTIPPPNVEIADVHTTDVKTA